MTMLARSGSRYPLVMKKVVASLLAAPFVFFLGRAVGEPMLAQWGADMKRETTGLLQSVDALTWQTWR
jgi:hypothetical protein